MTPNTMERAMERWIRAGMTVANLGGRFRTLHAAIRGRWRTGCWSRIRWTYVRAAPARTAVAPAFGEVRRLIQTADSLVDQAAAAVAERPYQRGRCLRLFRAQQNALMVRLAADAALRRGEVVALRTDDLSGRT